MNRTKVFLSYSRKDDEWRARLVSHLEVLVSTEVIELWDDSHLAPGEDFEMRIRDSLTQARLAILLISPEFLTSGFIRQVEVPQVLDQHAAGGMLIYPLLVRDCAWQEVGWLARMQIRPRHMKPVASSPGELDRVLAEVAREIASMVRGFSQSDFNMPSNSSAHNSNSQAPFVKDMYYLRSTGDPGCALEIVLENPSITTIHIHYAALRCRRAFGLGPMCPPPQYVYRADLEILVGSEGLRIDAGQYVLGEEILSEEVMLGGLISENNDVWGRPLKGSLFVSSAVTELEVAFPFHFTLEAREHSLLRLVFGKPRLVKLDHAPRRRASRHVSLDASAGTIPVLGDEERFDRSGETLVVLHCGPASSAFGQRASEQHIAAMVRDAALLRWFSDIESCKGSSLSRDFEESRRR